MVKDIANPPEIVKVRAERETLLVRLPRWFIQRHKLTSKSYLVFRDLLRGNMELVLWEDHIGKKKRIGAHKR